MEKNSLRKKLRAGLILTLIGVMAAVPGQAVSVLKTKTGMVKNVAEAGSRAEKEEDTGTGPDGAADSGILADTGGSETEKDGADGAGLAGFQIAPYLDLIVGPLEIDGLAAKNRLWIQEDAELEALCEYIRAKEGYWKEERAAELEAAGIPREQQCFLYGDGFHDVSRQILAMTAVFRNYTFYNRVVCQWYADYLWNESHTYQIVVEDGQRTAASLQLVAAEDAVEEQVLPDGNTRKGVKGIDGVLLPGSRVTIIINNRPREEIYNADAFVSRIPIEWGGWTEEKRQECEGLLSLDEESFRETLLKRQGESLLYSPVPFYKQGALEWGSKPFGNGTLASDACCPAAIAMALSGLKNEWITPAEIAERYDNDLYRSREQGSYGGKMCMAAGTDYGLKVEAGVDSLSGEKIREALESGAKIVMSMKPGDGGGRYATVYHYVTLAGLTEDGRVIVNNPGINTDITYDDMETILKNQSGRGYGIFRNP